MPNIPAPRQTSVNTVTECDTARTCEMNSLDPIG